MTDEINQPIPGPYASINEATKQAGFSMASDILTCSLLRTLAATKKEGKFLELGTGTGLATSWILDGMDAKSTITSVDNNVDLLAIAKKFLGHDKRLQLVHADGEDWIHDNAMYKFDYIFADTWPGKYLLLDEILDMLNNGGLYIVDDMQCQPNWPEGHDEKAAKLVQYLDSRKDLLLTKQNWSTGMIIAAKK